MLIVYTLTDNEINSRDRRAETLLAEMARGDIDALGELYELIETDVFAYALSKAQSRQDAEDIAQDTFMRIWKCAKQYKPQGKPLAWIFTIEINLIRKRYCSDNRSVPFDETLKSESDDGSFVQNVIDNEFLRQIMLALSEEEREIVSLHIVSGLKHREIAKLLEKPLSTVLSKYNRAIKKLQVQFR